MVVRAALYLEELGYFIQAGRIYSTTFPPPPKAHYSKQPLCSCRLSARGKLGIAGTSLGQPTRHPGHITPESRSTLLPSRRWVTETRLYIYPSHVRIAVPAQPPISIKMPEEHDTHTETESEDGGVALVKYRSSDEMDIDADSSATSASPSPSQPSSGEFADTDETAGVPILDSANSPSLQIGDTSVIADAGGGTVDLITYTPPANSETTPISFAEALSGELSTLPEQNTFHSEEEPWDPSHPLDPPFGTPHTFPTPLAAASDAPVTEEGAGSLTMVPQASQFSHFLADWHVSSMAAPAGSYSPHYSALPSLTDVFGSEFLSQSDPPADVPSPTFVDEYPADYWDDVEDNPKNFYCDYFFNYWRGKYVNEAPHYPSISDLANHPSKVQRPKKVSVDQLGWEHDDIQGIHWSRFQTTKKRAREVRRMTYRNHRNVGQRQIGFGTPGYQAHFHNNVIPSSDTYFRFHEMNMKYRPSYSHFQLRHNLSSCSKNAIFYSHRPLNDDPFDTPVFDEGALVAKIMCYNPEADTTECAIDPTKMTNKDAPRLDRLTTLTASDGVLVAGSIEGVYAIKSLSNTFETEPTTGVITEDSNCSTNHIHTILDRHSGLPHAVISSNDKTIRTLDCTTNKFTRAHSFPYQVNCSATSPDGRLRLLVGDDTYPIVSNAETGEILNKLSNHEDYGFACAWAPDGITMATGHQDGLVQVWDARKTSRSIHTIPMEMGGCRALQFSPLGSGKRVLVLAEPADFVHVVDAQTYNSKQSIDFFGEIAGISMPPDGSRLNIANSDPHYGGLIEYERSWNRTGYGRPPKERCSLSDMQFAEEIWNVEDEASDILYPGGMCYPNCIIFDAEKRRRRFREREKGYKLDIARTLDWLSDEDIEIDETVRFSRASRERQPVGLKDLIL